MNTGDVTRRRENRSTFKYVLFGESIIAWEPENRRVNCSLSQSDAEKKMAVYGFGV
jgi:hypothetical protein